MQSLGSALAHSQTVRLTSVQLRTELDAVRVQLHSEQQHRGVVQAGYDQVLDNLIAERRLRAVEQQRCLMATGQRDTAQNALRAAQHSRAAATRQLETAQIALRAEQQRRVGTARQLDTARAALRAEQQQSRERQSGMELQVQQLQAQLKREQSNSQLASTAAIKAAKVCTVICLSACLCTCVCSLTHLVNLWFDSVSLPHCLSICLSVMCVSLFCWCDIFCGC